MSKLCSTGQPGQHAYAARGYDFYETPAVAVEALLDAEVEFFSSNIRVNEPTAGNGAIAIALRDRGIPATPLVFFDPQFREVLDKLAYGNEGARQVERCNLPQMSADYIDACCSLRCFVAS